MQMHKILKPRVNLTQLDNGLIRIEYAVGAKPESKDVAPGPELAEAIATAMQDQAEYLTAAAIRRQCKLHDDVHYGVNTKEGYGHGLELANRCFGPRQHKRRLPVQPNDPHTLASGLELI